MSNFSKSDSLTQARQKAMNFLSRREYAVKELRQRLIKAEFDPSVVETVLAQLQAEHLLSNDRFIESLIRSRMSKGCGPLRIQHELQQAGIENESIAAAVDNRNEKWIEQVRQVRVKRFGKSLPTDQKEKAKQFRFLQYRGFTSEQIKAALTCERES